MEILNIFFQIFFVMLVIGAALGFVLAFRGDYRLFPITVEFVFDLVQEALKLALKDHAPNFISAQYHFLTPVEMVIMSWFFYMHLRFSYFRKILVFGTVAFILFSVCNSLFFETLREPPNNTFGLENLLLLVFAMMLIVEQLDLPPEINLWKNPVFVVASAILFFNLFSFFTFYLGKYLRSADAFSGSQALLWFAIFGYYSLLLLGQILSFNKSVKFEFTG